MRDPWAWLSLLSALPLLFLLLGAPLGQPVADDFHYLHHILFTRHWSWLDGGGSVLYWRPVARQLYYGLLLEPLLRAPILVALLHVVLLALTALAFYCTFRPRASGPVAFSIASFPLFMESSRMLVAWPSNFQDLGALLFVALALHEVSRSRLSTFLAASLAAVLCKEVGAIGVALALVCPEIAPRPLRRWLLWAASLLALLIAWGLVYRWVFSHAPLVLPRPAEADAGHRATTWLLHYAAILSWTARAMFSLPPVATSLDLPSFMALAVLGVATLGLARAGSAEMRARIRMSLPWLVWGLVWFLVLAATLVFFYPSWEPYRCAFVVVGFGVAATMLLGSITPRLLIALLAVRLTMFVLAPGPATGVRSRADEAGASIDIPQLTRLQRLVTSIHAELHERYPRLPSGARVAQHNFPLMSGYALAASKALQVWYRDSTLRWVGISEWYEGREAGVIAIAEFQNVPDDPIALVDPGAMRHLFAAVNDLRERSWTQALARLDSAASLESRGRARMFCGTVQAKRAIALAATNRPREAEIPARQSRLLNPMDPEAHFMLGTLWCRQGRLDEAEAQLDTVKWLSPEGPDAERLLDEIRAARAHGGLRLGQ